MKYDPSTPPSNTTTEKHVAGRHPLRHQISTETLGQLVKQHGYRKASAITGVSRSSIWARLRPEQAKIPRGIKAVKTVQVTWHLEYGAAASATNEPAIVCALRQNLKTFLTRAVRLCGLSTMPNRKASTIETHLKRINMALARLAMLHLLHTERSAQNVDWARLSPEDVAHGCVFISNIQERIVQVLAVMLLRRDFQSYQEIPRIYRSERVEISIDAKTLAGQIPSRRKKITYVKIAANSDCCREQIKKIETEAFRKLRMLLKPELEDLWTYLS